MIALLRMWGGCTSIRWLPGSTTTPLVFLFQRCFFRWRCRLVKLKPRLWQNSLHRMPLLMNSATS